MKKILITGGNGFIARNLREQLAGEYELIAPKSQELNLLEADLVLEQLKKNKYDIVVHTATYDAAPPHATKDPAKVLENNLRMYFNLVRGKKYFGKLIYFGSGAEYDRSHWLPKMSEDYFERHVPADQYGFSKYLMTQHALTAKNIYNLRLFAVFGKYDDWRVRIVSHLCRCAALNQPLSIRQNKRYDFVYIDDLIKIIKWFVENQPPESAYNICSGQVYDFKTIAEQVNQIAGKNLEIIIENKTWGGEYSGDNTRLLGAMKDWQFTPLARSIKALYDLYEGNKDQENI